MNVQNFQRFYKAEKKKEKKKKIIVETEIKTIRTLIQSTVLHIQTNV